MRLYVLPSDVFVWVFVACCVGFIAWGARQHFYREAWRRVCQQKQALFCLAVVVVYGAVALLDSVHVVFPVLGQNGEVVKTSKRITYNTTPVSAMELLLAKVYGGIEFKDNRLDVSIEKTYSSPLATTAFDKEQDDKGEWSQAPLAAPRKHWWGTDKAGGDIFYKLLKGIRTALVVGLVATMLVVPLSIVFGVLAGYFGGKVDDAIQFLYLTLSSVPSILLISAMMLIVKTRFQTATASEYIRDDTIVLLLCTILALISWAGLCRLLRAETIKLRELDYVKGARALGVSHSKIILKHIIPNVLHIVLISAILRFSGLVMIETVLTYINIGVPQTVYGWGRVVNGARLQLGRDPIIWWPVVGVFVFMFVLVLCINIVGDAVRDALDPKLRT